MPAEPRAVLIDERLLLQLLFTILQGHSLSTTAYQLSLLLRQDALAYFALVEAHLLQEQIDPVSEYVRDEFVCPVLYCKQRLQRHLGCYITKIFTKTKFRGEDVFVGDQCTKAKWYLQFERYICRILIICTIILLVNLDNATLHVMVSTLAFILPRLKESTNNKIHQHNIK